MRWVCGIAALLLGFGLAATAQSSDYLQSFSNICVGDGNSFSTALPCPAGLSGPCAYTITAQATSYHWWESAPNANYLVFGTATDYSNWNNNQPYNTVAGPSAGSNDDDSLDYFSSGQFYVPSGATFIFVAYNGNSLEDMQLSGTIEYYPNVAAGSNTSSPSSGASQYSGSSTPSDVALFALGFFMGLDDNGPYTPPPLSCLNGMSTAFNDVSALVSNFQQGASGSALLSGIEQTYSDFSTALASCNPNSCPGFVQSLFDDALQLAIQLIPGVDVVADGAKLLYDGYNLMDDVAALSEASHWYERGFDTAHIVMELKSVVESGYSALKSVVGSGSGGSNRRRHTHNRTHTHNHTYPPGAASSGTLARAGNVSHTLPMRPDAVGMSTLRRNDGVVRSLAQWRQLYGRATGDVMPSPNLAAAAAAPATTTSSSSSSALSTGATVGLAVGAVAGVVLLAGLATVAVRRRMQQARQPEKKHQQQIAGLPAGAGAESTLSTSTPYMRFDGVAEA